MLELHSEEIHCYFTDSSRTGIVSTDTGTAMVISKDGGQTWLPSFGNTPNYVIRMKWEQDGHAYFNHQMPSVIKLAGSNELACAVETNKEGTYYISLVYSGEDGEWDYLNVDQEGPIDSNNPLFLWLCSVFGSVSIGRNSSFVQPIFYLLYENGGYQRT